MTFQIRLFRAVVDTGHFGRAAESVTSPLLQSIHQLERQLGVELFERTRP